MSIDVDDVVGLDVVHGFLRVGAGGFASADEGRYLLMVFLSAGFLCFGGLVE